MDIPHLPTAIKNRARKYQKEDPKGNKNTDSLLLAFRWHLTPEYKTNPKYWSELHNAKEFFTIERNE